MRAHESVGEFDGRRVLAFSGARDKSEIAKAAPKGAGFGLSIRNKIHGIQFNTIMLL
jgi:hypothetical protein